MSNPSGTTHDRSITDKSLLKEQMAILGDLKDLLTDTSKKNKKAFIVCQKSTDGRHHFEFVQENKIRVKLKRGGTKMVNSYTFDGYRHFYEQCTSCSKLTMSCERLV